MEFQHVSTQSYKSSANDQCQAVVTQPRTWRGSLAQVLRARASWECMQVPKQILNDFEAINMEKLRFVLPKTSQTNPVPVPIREQQSSRSLRPALEKTDVSLASYSTSVVAAAERMPWPAAEGRRGWGKNHRIHPGEMFLFFWKNCTSGKVCKMKHWEQGKASQTQRFAHSLCGSAIECQALYVAPEISWWLAKSTADMS